MTDDLISVFNYMTGRSRQRDFNKLLVAPITMKKRIIEMIEREVLQHSADNPGYIIAKMNQLEDRAVTDALYRASQAGVRIDLIVRGFCCLRPGVPGLSDNIRVCSIIGRFLEHSRIFYFKNGRSDPIDGEFSIGSADWMYRNLNTRVEVVAPIEDRASRRRLWQILEWCLTDRRQAWEMQPDGSYVPRSTEGLPPDAPEAIGAHQRLMNAARESVERARLEE
jgi:polyphosphate kinase